MHITNFRYNTVSHLKEKLDHVEFYPMPWYVPSVLCKMIFCDLWKDFRCCQIFLLLSIQRQNGLSDPVKICTYIYPISGLKRLASKTKSQDLLDFNEQQQRELQKVFSNIYRTIMRGNISDQCLIWVLSRRKWWIYIYDLIRGKIYYETCKEI